MPDSFLNEIHPGDLVEFIRGAIGTVVGIQKKKILMPLKTPMVVEAIDKEGVIVKEQQKDTSAYYRVDKVDIKYHFPHFMREDKK